MNTLAISTSSFDIDNNPPLQQLLQKDFRIMSNPHRRKLTEDEIIELLSGGIVGLIAGIEPLTERVFQSAPALKVISRLLAAQTVGIIGLGHIGRRVAKLCQAFEAKVIAHDPFATQIPEGVTLMPLEPLLSCADIVTLHLPYSAKTHHLLDHNALQSLKPEAIIINTARGGLVDECALAEALNNGCTRYI